MCNKTIPTKLVPIILNMNNQYILHNTLHYDRISANLQLKYNEERSRI